LGWRERHVLILDRHRCATPSAMSGIVERLVTRTLRRPPTIRGAGGVIVSVTMATVVAAGVLMRVFDHEEFPNVWLGMWWALQTVTTVGYGDIVPKQLSGRIIGAVVMLEGIAFLTVVTAVITSTFIERGRREREVAEGTPEPAQVEQALASVDERLARIEQKLSER
jgi:voltage-gated potassium channel